MNKMEAVIGEYYTNSERKKGRFADRTGHVHVEEGSIFRCVGKLTQARRPMFLLDSGEVITFREHYYIEKVEKLSETRDYEIVKKRVEKFLELFHKEAEKLKRLKAQKAQDKYFNSREEYENWMIQEIIKHEGKEEIIGKIIRGEWAVEQLEEKRKA